MQKVGGFSRTSTKPEAPTAGGDRRRRRQYRRMSGDEVDERFLEDGSSRMAISVSLDAMFAGHFGHLRRNLINLVDVVTCSSLSQSTYQTFFEYCC